MAAHTKVTNLTDGRKIKRSQALRRISECLSVWVEEGFSIRDMSLAEMVSHRSEMARKNLPLASSELPGIKYVGPVNADRPIMLQEARQFAASL